MDRTLSLTKLVSISLKNFYINCIDILKEFIKTMTSQLTPGGSGQEDPRLHASGSFIEMTDESIIDQANAIRRKMMTDKTKVGHGISHPSTELLTKVDNILSAVNTLQSGQREIYNLMKAMTPRFSKSKSEGPTNHLETVGLTNTAADARYLETLRERSRSRRPRDQ